MGDVNDRVYPVVRVGSAEIPYVRAGRGAPVLLFTAGTAAAIAAGALFTRLSREFRVVAPVFDACAMHPGSERPGSFPFPLRDLLEGLGMEQPLVVAERQWRPFLTSGAQANQPEVAAAVFYDMADDPSLDELLRLLRNAVNEQT